MATTTKLKASKLAKHDALNNGTYYKYKQTRTYLNKIKPQYKQTIEDKETGELITTLTSDYFDLQESTYNALKDIISPQTLKHCEQIDHNKYKRTTRLRKRIRHMMAKYQCYFITLTFTDEVLSNTSEETRRQYVRRTLQSFSTEYVANIDYGTDNGREHYHALTNAPIESWAYGFFNVKKVANRETSITKIPIYITKLGHHSLKHTTKGSYLIYSRS